MVTPIRVRAISMAILLWVMEMSATVQFIYITHNKIAMEMADQLMGVTMHEPGCSRLVAVDVEEALAMVEA